MEKNAEPITTSKSAASRFRGFRSGDPQDADSQRPRRTWLMARTPEAKALPATRADRGVGVAISFVSTPASRSQMIWIP